MRKKPKCWSHAEGEEGEKVRVYERRPGGLLHARTFDPSLGGGRGGYRRASLKHRDQERAKTYALEQAAKLRQGYNELAAGKVRLSKVLAPYLAYRTPRKSETEQDADDRRSKLWTRVLGPNKDPHLIRLAEWERFIDQRSSGSIDGLGMPVEEKKRKPVRPRTVQHDCQWLRWALNWATNWRVEGGRYLLRENPVRGFEAPTEKNPRRPVASTDRYEALRRVSDKVMMEFRWGEEWQKQRSYLSELLGLAYGTGRRISAILALRYADLRLDAKPHGAICWPAATDKQGRETTAPLSPAVRAAIDRVIKDRPALGPVYLFPSPTSKTEPVSYERVRTWLLEAEKLAELPKLKGSLWHAFRRAWATARKHLPLKDTAAAGGWASTETLLRCYPPPDEETMLEGVLNRAELRGRNAK